MIEYLIAASILTNVANGYRTLFPVQNQKNIPVPQHTSLMPTSSGTAIQHVTSTDGDGANPVFNVSFVNSPAGDVPSSSSNLASTQRSFRTTFDSVNFSDITATTYEYCNNNKYYIAALSIACMYGYIFYKIRMIQAYLDNSLSWSAWKKDIPFDQLLTIPQDQLTRDLMMVIQTRYVTPQNPTDILTPLITFSKEITKEQELVTHYHHYITWCTHLCLQKILPISETLLSQLTERRQRVIYINTLFQSWLTQYKLEQITGSTSRM